MPIKNMFFDLLRLEGDKIKADFEYVSCRVYANFPPEDEREYSIFSLYIDCLLKQAPFENSDNVALGVLAYDHNNKFSINAEIVWGHPFGKIEGEVFDEPAELNDNNLKIMGERLPGLISKLRKVLSENPYGLGNH